MVSTSLALLVASTSQYIWFLEGCKLLLISEWYLPLKETLKPLGASQGYIHKAKARSAENMIGEPTKCI